ncbi:MAG: thioredoxin family protein [Candidatus Hodarchaeales archaeon]|jgi:hypothetical protein
MNLPSKITQKKGKHIQIFTDNCSICEKHIINVEIGKCAGCKLEVFLINEESEMIQQKIKNYSISTHPTTIIDEEIKVEGMPSFLWMCGDEFYERLRKEFPLTHK